MGEGGREAREFGILVCSYLLLGIEIREEALTLSLSFLLLNGEIRDTTFLPSLSPLSPLSPFVPLSTLSCVLILSLFRVDGVTVKG
jgi:hypothetical protein